jgi:hypothetical protein
MSHSFFVGVHASATSAGSPPLASTSITVIVGCTGFGDETGRELGAVISGVCVFSSLTIKYISQDKLSLPFMQNSGTGRIQYTPSRLVVIGSFDMSLR